MQREAQDFVDRDVHLQIVRGGQWSPIAKVEGVAVLVTVAVFAIERDPQATSTVAKISFNPARIS